MCFVGKLLVSRKKQNTSSEKSSDETKEVGARQEYINQEK